jgi:hypothetical protein
MPSNSIPVRRLSFLRTSFHFEGVKTDSDGFELISAPIYWILMLVANFLEPNSSGRLYQPPPPPPPELPPPPPPPELLELGAETPEAIPAAATLQEAMAPAPPN